MKTVQLFYIIINALIYILIFFFFFNRVCALDLLSLLSKRKWVCYKQSSGFFMCCNFGTVKIKVHVPVKEKNTSIFLQCIWVQLTFVCTCVFSFTFCYYLAVWLHHVGRTSLCVSDHPHSVWTFCSHISQQSKNQVTEDWLDM